MSRIDDITKKPELATLDDIEILIELIQDYQAEVYDMTLKMEEMQLQLDLTGGYTDEPHERTPWR